MSENIEIQNSIFKIHPVYNLYAGNQNGEIIHIIKTKPFSGPITNNEYKSIKKYGDKHPKSMQAHRFIWECFNELIQKETVIDHKNNVRFDNRHCNLQLLTKQDNCKKISRKQSLHICKK